MKGFVVQAEKNRAYLDLGGVRVWLGSGVIADGGRMFIAKRDMDKTVSPILSPQPVSIPQLRTIVIDPGHGGKDPGKQNLSLGLNEKTMALDVAGRLKSILEVKGYRVVVTRTRDAFIELDDRAAIANKAKADLFVSIHFNARTGRRQRRGEPTASRPPGQYSTNDKSSEAATPAHGLRQPQRRVEHPPRLLRAEDSLRQTGHRRPRCASRALRRAARHRLLGRAHRMRLHEQPHDEVKRIATPTYRERIAQGVADAIPQYHNRLYRLARKSATPSVQTASSR